MAKKSVVVTPKTKKQKLLNVLRIVGICFGAVIGIVAGAIVYVWATGGFNPPYVPLTELSFSQNEYVLSDLDNIRLVPNEGCTELDAVIKIGDTNIVQLVQDENTIGISDNSSEQEPDVAPQTEDEDAQIQIFEKYNVKINSDIQIVPVKKTITKIVDGEPQEVTVNFGGWVKLIAEQGLYQTSCWVFVDVPVEEMGAEVTTTQDVEQDAEDADVYYVYPNSSIQLGINNIYPSNSFVVPATNIPSDKGSTEYNLSKNIFYEVSDTDKATINNNGLLTIKSNVEGSFTVYAYVISSYNNIGKEPNREDYIKEHGLEAGIINWQTDFDKIRVKTQTLTFNIKEVSVDAVLTDREAQGDNMLEYDMLQKDLYVYAGNTETTHYDTDHNVYHYFVDLSLTYGTEQEYKDSLMNKIQLFAGYIDNNSQDENAIVIDSNKIIIDDSYIKISERISPTVLSWKITLDRYLDAQNVLVFGYPTTDQEGNTTYLYNYVNIKVNKVMATGLAFTSAIPATKNIDIAWNDAENAIQEPINLNGTVSVDPANATYQTVMYFAEADTMVIETDSSKKIKPSDGKEYYAICKTLAGAEGEEPTLAYNWINPTQLGSVKIVAAVLRTDSHGNLIVGADGSYDVEYAGISQDIITINVSKQIAVTSYSVTDADGNVILDNGHVTVSINDVFKVVLECDDDITSTNLFGYSVSDGDDGAVSLSSSQIDVTNRKITFTFSADKVVEDLLLTIVNENGNLFNGMNLISVTIEDTQLEKLELSTNAEYGVSVNVNPTTGSYTWVTVNQDGSLSSESLAFNLTYIPSNTTSKDAVLTAYQVPDGVDQTTDLSTLNIVELIESSAVSIANDANGDVSKAIINILKAEDIIVVASSPAAEIYSNPIYISISLPYISIEFTDNLSSQQIVSKDGAMESLTTYTSTADSLLQGEKFNAYIVDNNLNKMDIKNFIKFKFMSSYTTDQNGYLVSDNSGVKIDNDSKTLILTDLVESTMENILFYTDFGYVSTEYFTYNLVADYNVQIENTYSYFAPGLVDLFSDFVRVDNPSDAQVAQYYEKSNGTYALTTDLAVDTSKVYYQKTSGYVQVAEPTKAKLYSYYEFDGTDYSKTIDEELDITKTYYQFVANPAVMFTNLDGTILYLPTDYDYQNNLSPEYLKHFSYVEDEETKYNIQTVLHLSMQGANYTIYNKYNCGTDTSLIGNIRINRIPADQQSVGINIAVLKSDESFGYKTLYTLKVNPIVASNFTCNGEDENNNPYLMVEVPCDNDNLFAGSTTFELDLTGKINYMSVTDTSTPNVTVNSVKFSANYVSIVDVNTLNNGLSLARFVSTQDQTVLEGKSYFIKDGTEFVLVASPVTEELDTYYQVECEYAKIVDNKIVLNSGILEQNIANLQIKLEINSTVTVQGVSANITDYYIINFEFMN